MQASQDHNEHESNCAEKRSQRIPIVIDKVKYRAPKREMTGSELRALARPPIGADKDLWNDVVDALDEVVEDDEVVQLDRDMRFFSVPREINPGEATMSPDLDLSALNESGVDVVVTKQGSMVHVVVANFPVPDGLSSVRVDLLLRLPLGFPDAAPDMFWVSPSLTLENGAAVGGTQSVETYEARQWQRWSRHIGGQWRAGIDDLDTYVAFVRSCLRTAVRRAS